MKNKALDKARGNEAEMANISLAWSDRFFPFLFVVAEKRVWSGLHTRLVLAPRRVTIEHVIVAQVYGRVRLLFGQFVDVAYRGCIKTHDSESRGQEEAAVRDE